MGNLEITNVQQYGEFIYTDGNYRYTGSYRATSEGLVTAIDNGQIVKNGNYLGNFYVSGDNGTYTTNINNIPLGDITAVSTAIAEIVEAINERPEQAEEAE